MSPRPVVQFLLRIKAPSITPACLVSSEALTNPNATIYILSKMEDGARVCLSVCVFLSPSFSTAQSPEI